MKKILVLLTTVFVLLGAMSFTACGGHKHDMKMYEAVEATCTAEGNDRYYVCQDCDKIYSDINGVNELTKVPTIAKKAHVYDNKFAFAEYRVSGVTCTEKAVYYYSCDCGAAGTETFEAETPTGHYGGQATCDKQAVCEGCGEPYGDLLAHEYDQKVVSATYLASEATCEVLAEYYYSCECGAKGEKTFKNGELAAHKGGEASCTSQAICEVCEEYYGKYLPHVYDQQVATEEYLKSEATCDEPAKYYYSCECGMEGADVFEVGEAAGHSWVQVVDEEYLVSEATCTNKAVYYESCENCGDVSLVTFETGEVDEDAHDWVQVVDDEYLATEADCENAATYYESCSRCGVEGTITFAYGEIAGHSEGEVALPDYLVSEANCTSKAIYNKSCVVCGEEVEGTFEYGEIAADAHDMQQIVDDEFIKSWATCQEAAVYYVSCSRCGTKGSEFFSDGEPNPDAHLRTNIWEDRYIATEANCSNPATYYMGCQNCDVVLTDEAPVSHGDLNPNVHDWIEYEDDAFLKSEANCAGGAVYYKACNLCEISAEEVDPSLTFTVGGATGTHNWVEVVSEDYLVSEANCSSPAVYYKSCSVCLNAGEETFTDGDADPNTHDWIEYEDDAFLKSEADCVNPATYYKACNLCETSAEGIDETQTFTVGVALGHTGGTATCEVLAECTVCGEPYGEYADHSAKVLFVDEAKTAESTANDASYYPTCTVCGEVDTTAEAVSVKAIAGVEAGMAVSVEDGLNLTTAEGFTATRYSVQNGAETIATWVTGEDYAAFNAAVKAATADRRYTLTYTISDGTNSATQYVTFSIVNATTVQVFVTEAQKGNVIDHDDNNTYRNEVKYVAEAAGRTGVLQWDSDATFGQKDTQITFASGVRSSVKKDMYLRFDIWMSAGFHLTIGQKTGQVYAYGAYDTTQTQNIYRNNQGVKLYDEQGNFLTTGAIHDGTLKNQWITVEWQMTADWVHSAWRSFLYNYSTSTLSGKTIYLDNVVASATSLGDGATAYTVLDSKEDLENGNMTVSTYAPNTTLTYVAEAAGRKEIFQWACTDNTAASTKTFLWISKPFASYMKVGTYLVFDIYVESGTLTLYSATNEQYLYGEPSVVEENHFSTLWDADGNKITSGSFSAGSFAGKWITVQVKLEETYTTGAQWRGIGVLTADNGHQLAGKTVYLDNVRVSVDPIMA